jgi:hypothetical protein
VTGIVAGVVTGVVAGVVASILVPGVVGRVRAFAGIHDLRRAVPVRA